MSRFEPIEWEMVMSRVGSEQEDWLFVSGVGTDHLGPLSTALGIPEVALRRRLFDATFPRFDHLDRLVTFFAWYPSVANGETWQALRVSRVGLLLVDRRRM